MKSTYSDTYTGADLGIDVLSCVQGNTAIVRDLQEREPLRRANTSCVVYEFRRASGSSANVGKDQESVASKKRAYARKRAARARARKVRAIRTLLLSALLVVVFSLGGIVSSAHSKKAPDAYKYYDTITVGYHENLLDIVQKYDDRNYYETQRDYLKELCRINNLAYDESAYPDVAPGTLLVVPYYSAELK